MTKLPVKLFSEDANIPTRGSEEAAGLDLYSVEDIVLGSGARELIQTGVGMDIPKGYVGIVKSRSGLAARHGLEVGAGVIDSDYRGEIKVLLYNNSLNTYHIKAGDRIAQILLIPVLMDVEVEQVYTLDQTDRGYEGFGSTGV